MEAHASTPVEGLRPRKARDRDLVRRVALLLTTGASLEEFFAQACAYVGSIFEAATVFVHLVESDHLKTAYRWQRGAGESCSQSVHDPSVAAVVESGSAVIENVLENESERAALHVAIGFGGEVLGVLTLVGAPRVAYEVEDAELLEVFAVYLGLRVRDEHLRRTADQYGRLATVDALTGITNRRGFDAKLEAEWRRCARNRSPLAVILVDIDHFKGYNDHYGHVRGDECLRQVAAIIAHAARRQSDCCARYGGEEFALILPETTLDEARRLAERMRAAINDARLDHEAVSGIVTISVGVAARIPDFDRSPQELVVAADAMLYDAKRGGRDRVIAERTAEAGSHQDASTSSDIDVWRPQTRFIGREAELAAIGLCLRTSRVVTIAGKPGCGKSRLAIEAAVALESEFADGVYVLDVRALGSDVPLGLGLAASIGQRVADEGCDGGLLRRLRMHHSLFVLDACEFAPDRVRELVAEFLDQTLNVRFLITSGEALGLASEHVIALDSLEAETEAIDLFIDRARIVNPSISTEREHDAIVGVLRVLEGRALAIEFIAPMTALLPIGTLHAQLQLALRECDPERTLAVVVEWCLEFFSPMQRTLMRALSTLRDSWSRDLAVEIGMRLGFSNAFTLRALECFVARGVLTALRRGGEIRYRFHDVVIAWLVEELHEVGEWNEAQHAMAAALKALVSRGASARTARERSDALDAMFAERMTIDSALGWCLDREENLGLGIDLCIELTEFWARFLTLAERGLSWLDKALAHATQPAQQGDLLLSRSTLHHGLGDYIAARDDARRAIDLVTGLGDAHALARAQWRLGCALVMLGEMACAEPIALTAFERSLTTGDRKLSADLLRLLAILRHYSGDLLAAVSLNKEALDVHQKIADDYGAAVALNNLAELAYHRADHEAALHYCKDALRLFEVLGDRFRVGWQLANLALYEMAAGRLGDARRALREALTVHRGFGHQACLASCFDYFALLADECGQQHRSASLLAFADVLRLIYVPRQPPDTRLMDELRRRLRERVPERELDEQIAAGNAWTLERATQEAFNV